jgi:DNA-binding transcriptional MerR regulator
MATYTITELAREFDITPRAIRFYEDQGLLSPSREGAGGRTRVYGARDRTRLKLTLRGKRLGLSLAEIKDLIGMYNSTEDETPQLMECLRVMSSRRSALEQQQPALSPGCAMAGEPADTRSIPGARPESVAAARAVGRPGWHSCRGHHPARIKPW